MKLNLRLYFQTFYYSFFKSRGTPGRLTPKRFLILCFIFLFYPWWHLGIRIAYIFDNLFFPDHLDQEFPDAKFINIVLSPQSLRIRLDRTTLTH